jgi:hypothetical protein
MLGDLQPISNNSSIRILSRFQRKLKILLTTLHNYENTCLLICITRSYLIFLTLLALCIDIVNALTGPNKTLLFYIRWHSNLF